MTEKRDKVTVEDIIGLIDCEPTDSVEEVRKLRGRNEKRFTYEHDEYGGILFDNECKTFYHIEDTKKNIELLCNQLNDIVNENEQLEKKLQIYKSDGLETLEKLQRCYNNSKKAMKTIDALYEENEQLKQEVGYYKLILMSLEQEAKRISSIRGCKND